MKHSAKLATFNSDDQSFILFRRDLGDGDDWMVELPEGKKGMVLTSPSGKSEMVFVLATTQMDGGRITSWLFLPTPETIQTNPLIEDCRFIVRNA